MARQDQRQLNAALGAGDCTPPAAAARPDEMPGSCLSSTTPPDRKESAGLLQYSRHLISLTLASLDRSAARYISAKATGLAGDQLPPPLDVYCTELSTTPSGRPPGSGNLERVQGDQAGQSGPPSA